MEQGGDITKNIIDLRESLKIFEQRLSQMKDTIKMIDQNDIEKYNEMKTVLQGLNSALSGLKTKVMELDDAINRIEKESESFARLQDVKVIEKYLSFVDPSRFLNKDDVIKIVENYMTSKKCTPGKD